MNSGNSVVWETLQNSADWDCFKTLILQETLQIQHQHQEGSCVFSEVTRLCQQIARDKLQFHTVLQKLKSFLSMQVYAWDGITALTLWHMVIEVFHSAPEQNRTTQERATEKPVSNRQVKHAKPHPNQAHQRHSNIH